MPTGRWDGPTRLHFATVKLYAATSGTCGAERSRTPVRRSVGHDLDWSGTQDAVSIPRAHFCFCFCFSVLCIFFAISLVLMTFGAAGWAICA